MNPTLNVVVFCNVGQAVADWQVIKVAVDDLSRHSMRPVPTLLDVGLKQDTMLVAFYHTLPNTEATIPHNDRPLSVDRLCQLEHRHHCLSQPRRELRW